MAAQLLPLRLLRSTSLFLPRTPPFLRRSSLAFPLRSFSDRSLVDDEAELSDWVSDLKPGFVDGNNLSNPKSRDLDRSGSKSRGFEKSGFEKSGFRSRRMNGSDSEGEGGDVRRFGGGGGRRGGMRGGGGRDFGSDVGFRSVRGSRGGGMRGGGRRVAFGMSEEENDFSGDRRGMSGRRGRGSSSFGGRGRGDRMGGLGGRKPAFGLSSEEDVDDESSGDRRSGMSGRRGVGRGRGDRRGGLGGRKPAFGLSSEEDDNDEFSGDRRSGMSGRRGGGRGRGDTRGGVGGRKPEFGLSSEDDDGNNVGFSGGRRGMRGGGRTVSGSLSSRRGGGMTRGSGRGRRGPGFSSESAKRLDLSEDEDDSDSFDEECDLEEVLDSEDADDVEGGDLLQSRSSPLKQADGDGVQSTPRDMTGKESYLSDTRFDQCTLSPLSLKGLKAAGYERMTMVQEATLPVILKGKDVLAKAKTGTGKTVAFLLPAIEIVVKQPPVDRDNRRPPIHVLVVCPTRELANQAATEASTLLKFHPNLGAQFVVGGTRLALEQKRLQANPCQILVATPGRLRDHLENTPGFATRLMGVKVLVLDEADHLLDMGFRKDIERITAAVPKQRQSLLFSATVPDEVRQICHIVLKRDHEFINTVVEGSEETHSQVSQSLVVAPLDKHFSLLYHILKEHIADDVDYKVLVFCTTAMVTRLVAETLSELKLNVREIHSRKPQSYRTRVSDEFRKSKGLILVTSDVSARGVDYPDVTLVVQVGVPSDREQYIHRLGRTGRKGKEGQGILLLAPWEEYFASSIKDLPISKASTPTIDPDTSKKVERALNHLEMKIKESAYQAWLGYYNSNRSVGKDKHKLVELANEFSRSMGLDNPPVISKIVLGKMGLKNVSGLRSK